MNDDQYEQMRLAVTAALHTLSGEDIRELTIEPYRVFSDEVATTPAYGSTRASLPACEGR